jgi:hypothetical protein
MVNSGHKWKEPEGTFSAASSCFTLSGYGCEPKHDQTFSVTDDRGFGQHPDLLAPNRFAAKYG